jgi:hypothetical protein
LLEAVASHAEGLNTTTIGNSSHAEGYDTRAFGTYSHAEGASTTASGPWSHAEGDNTTALGQASHAEGQGTKALGQASHAEGVDTIASGPFSHAEGNLTYSAGENSHTEGQQTVTGYRSPLFDFDTFWIEYPKKVGKEAARKAWLKNKPDLDTVLNSLKWQKVSPQWFKNNGLYIPNPSTWINQHRWEDEQPNEGSPF